MITISKEAREYLQMWIDSVCEGKDEPTKASDEVLQELQELNLINSFGINHIEASKYFNYNVPA